MGELRCRHHPGCPGCGLLRRPYAAQLDVKRTRLADALSLFFHLPAAPEVEGSPWTAAYRHRVKLPVAVGRQGVAIGLYDAQRRVLDTPDCQVVTPALRQGLDTLRTLLRGHPEVHSVDLRVSDATGELQLVVAADGGALRGGAHTVRTWRRTMPGLASVAVSRADPERRRVMGASPGRVAGATFLAERVGETPLWIAPGAFFQVDPRRALALHRRVEDAVGDASDVLDLYAGVGAYGRMLARPGRRVVMVEEVPQAAEAARRFAPAGVEVIAGRVQDVRLPERVDVAVVNPSRRGADLATLTWLGERMRRLVYVSCGPETLARDLDVLAFHGLRVVRLEALDLFPQTPEVETVATLERGPPVQRWSMGDGLCASPWAGSPSGVVGRAEEVDALVVGNTGPRGVAAGCAWRRTGSAAGHSLLRLRTKGSVAEPLRALATGGHPVAGADPRTRAFFAEVAGLLRPFVHVRRASGVVAPWHGDLVLAWRALDGAFSESRPRRGTTARA